MLKRAWLARAASKTHNDRPRSLLRWPQMLEKVRLIVNVFREQVIMTNSINLLVVVAAVAAAVVVAVAAVVAVWP